MTWRTAKSDAPTTGCGGSLSAVALSNAANNVVHREERRPRNRMQSLSECSGADFDERLVFRPCLLLGYKSLGKSDVATDATNAVNAANTVNAANGNCDTNEDDCAM